MRETKNIEFKESITNTFLETVSAFANYEGGDIYFGIEDSGKIIGLEDVKSSCLDIEINVRAIPLSLDDGSSGLNVIM